MVRRVRVGGLAALLAAAWFLRPAPAEAQFGTGSGDAALILVVPLAAVPVLGVVADGFNLAAIIRGHRDGAGWVIVGALTGLMATVVGAFVIDAGKDLIGSIFLGYGLPSVALALGAWSRPTPREGRCESSTDCDSGVCRDGDCATEEELDGPYQCAEDHDCASGSCLGGFCREQAGDGRP